MKTLFPERFLDVTKLNVDDLAAVLVEARRAPNSERIKPYETWIGIDGQTPFPVGTETDLKRRELEGMKAVQYLARKGHKTIVWISPPGGSVENDECKYTEARMLVYQVESIDETKVNFKCVAVCSQHSPRECIDMANRVLNDGGETMGEPVVANDLRSEPVALPRDVVDWVDYLSLVVPGLDEVWEAIRQGDHEENSRKAWMMADVIVREFSKRTARVKNEWEAVSLGVEVERMIRTRFNINLMAGGVHGMSNEAAMNNMGPFDSTYTRAAEDKRLQKCPWCGNFYIKKKEKCPDCGV